MDAESSFELIARVQAGDASAMNALLERYRPRLQRWARSRLGRARDMADTEDIVQDVLVSAFKNLGTFEQRGEWALQGYLRRAVRNRILNEVEKLRDRPVRDEVPEDLMSRTPSPLDQAVGAEFMARYEAALERLPEPQREALVARLELGCSFKEIAFLLEKTSADAARMTVNRALEQLVTLLAES